MDSRSASAQYFAALLAGNLDNCQRIRALKPIVPYSDNQKGFASQRPFEMADQIKIWIADDTKWTPYFDKHILSWKTYLRSTSIFGSYPELPSEDIGVMNALTFPIFQQRHEIATKFRGTPGEGDNELETYSVIEDWALSHGDETKKLFNQARSLRVHSKIWFLAQPLPFLAAFSLSHQIAAFVHTSSATNLWPTTLAGAGAALGLQYLAGAVRRLRVCDRIKLLKQTYDSNAKTKSLRVGAEAAAKYEKLLEQQKEAHQYADNAGILYFHPQNPGMPSQMQARWLDIADHGGARAWALKKWVEIHAGFAFELFKSAYTTGHYRDHYFREGVPIRTLPRKWLGNGWRFSLLIAAAFAVRFSVLPNAIAQQALDAEGTIAAASLVAFVVSLVRGLMDSRRITADCADLVTWDDLRTYIETVTGQIRSDDMTILQHNIRKKIAEQKSASQAKADDIARGT